MFAQAPGLGWAAVIVACVAGCGPKPEPTSPAPAEPAAPTEAAEEPATPWSRCFDDFVGTGDPEADLGVLAKTCGTKLGQRALTPVRLGIQGEADAVDRFTFSAAPAGKCYRVMATGESGVRDIDLQVLGGDGRQLASDTSHRAWAIVPAREPLCLEGSEVVTVEVSVYRGSGKYALQVWTGDKR